VEGWGTLRESPAFHEFVDQSLDGPDKSTMVVLDLSKCDYLDSTFLGCLVGLHRRYNQTVPHRFQVAASCAQSQKLLAPTRLNHLLDLTEVYPEPIADVLEISRPLLPAADLGRHIMECHRRLAELGGPLAAPFQSAADQLARELGEPPGGGDPPADECELPSR
jgi:anti-anti-sigma factor